MAEEEYISLHLAGNKSNYSISSHYMSPESWRAPYVTRMFVHEDEDQPKRTLFYLVLLESDSAFDFPAVICGTYEIEPMTENKIYNEVYILDPIRSMAREKPRWKNLRMENGWCVGDPNSKIPVIQVHGYILNLFDLSDREKVIENILQLLTQEDGAPLELTVKKYVFPPLETGIGTEQA